MASTKYTPRHDENQTRVSEIWLHFLCLELHTHSERLHRWTTQYYNSLQQKELCASNEFRFSMHLEEIGSAHELRLEARTGGVFTKFCLANAHCFYENGVFYSSAEGRFAHQIEIDIVNRSMRANIGGEFLEAEESFIYNVLRGVLKRLILPSSQLITLHGSLITDGTRTILFTGDEGMGKSTVALKMAECGYSILSDDSPLFTYRENCTYALSSLDALSVTANTLRLFPDLKKMDLRKREISGKFFVGREDLGDQRFAAGPLTVTDCVQLRRGAYANASLTRTDKSQAAGELLRETMFLFRPELTVPARPEMFAHITRFMFDTIVQLFDRASTYRLEYADCHLEQLPSILDASRTSKSAPNLCTADRFVHR